MTGNKATAFLGMALACVVAVFMLFSAAGELREKWPNAGSFGKSVLSAFGVSFGARSSGYSEYWTSFQQTSKAVGASGKQWVGVRSASYGSTEEFLRKCLQLGVITERLDRDVRNFGMVCDQTKQRERDLVRSKADQWRARTCGNWAQAYASLVTAQQQQLSAIEKASGGWSDASKSLAELERTASVYELAVEGQFRVLLTTIERDLEDSTNEGIQFNAYDVKLIRPR